MRLITLLGLAAFCLAVPAADLAAQGMRGGGPGPGMGLAARALIHADELGLSEEQTVSLEEIRGEAEEATREIRDRLRGLRGTGDREAMRAGMREMRDALAPFDERAVALLTDDQRSRLEELRPARRRPRGGTGP